MPSREPASEIEDAATIWAARAERGLTESEKAEFEEWMEGDSRRLGAYVRAQAAWIHAERAAALGKMPDQASEPAMDVLPIEHARPRAFSRRTVLGGGGAIAASVAAAYMVGFSRYYTLESGVGEIRHIALKGGTTLALDTDTRVDVALSSNDRKLELIQGKLFLEVAKSDFPVTVRAGNLIAETMEGAFSLEHLLRVPIVALVTEGRLVVSQSPNMFAGRRSLSIDPGHALTLAPNEELVASKVQPLAGAQQAQLLAWRDGMLSFGGELLSDAVRAFDRYSSARIVVTDPDLARQRITGLFRATDPRGFAVAIAASFASVATSQGDVIRISSK